MIVCATIVEDERVLLVRHSSKQKPDYGDWLLPAGRVKSGESLEEALERELMEETRLKVRIVKKLTEHIDPYTGDYIANFLCLPLTSKVELSPELEEGRWFACEEIKRLKNINQGLKKFLIEGLKTGLFINNR